MENRSEHADFSDDSIEICSKSQKKMKQIYRPKRTYKQIHQQRQVAELLRVVKPSENFGENVKYPTRVCSLETINNSNVEKSIKPKKPSKSISTLWSAFLSKKNQSDKPESLEKLQRRLEYGKRMNSINKFNHLCLKSTQSRVIESEREFIEKEESKDEKKTESLIDSALTISFDETKKRLQEIPIKLHQLRLQHRNDQKLVEEIRNSLQIKFIKH